MRKQPNMNAGAAGLFIIFSLLFFVLIYRFVSIQWTGEVGGQALAARAELKHTKEKELDARRGTIYDRTGETIAEDTTSYTLAAILNDSMTTDPKKPKHVVDPKKTARELSKFIDVSEAEIYKQLTKEGMFQVEFGKAGSDISHDKKEQIEALKLPGIIFMRDMKRFYPNGVFSSHVIGFVEKQENENGAVSSVGKLGLEQQLDTILRGKPGIIHYQGDRWGFLLPDGKEQIKPAKDGKDVYLTLDKKIQTFLEDAISKVDKEYKPKKIIAIVADPKTGEILAMAQRPTFHPKTREGLEKSWYNEAIETSFEPGSTMKIFTLAAAVQENVFNGNADYQSGRYKVTENSAEIGDHNGHGWGRITYLEGVQRSSNVAFAKIAAEQLGFDRYREYLTKFGLDKPTGIDLPNEVSSKIVYTYPIDKITTAYGQGTAITPIQQIQAAIAVANDGKMLKPHVIDRIVDSETGKVIEDSQPEVTGEPISAETAKEVREILETVITSEKGTGHERYQIDGYDVAGKTGTAEISGSGGYLKGKQDYIFSFLGMAPTDDPELIMYVAVQQPEVATYFEGSKPVSEIFKPVMKSSLQYLNIEPVTQKETAVSKMPDLLNTNVANAQEKLKTNGFDIVTVGKGTNVTAQLPKKGANILAGERVFIRTDGELSVPDMRGWSRRDVMSFAKLANLKLNVTGNGYVAEQSLPADAALAEGEYLIVHLETPEQLNKAEKAGEPAKSTEAVESNEAGQPDQTGEQAETEGNVQD
ncbi:penicillin-binding protein [Bacillus canaveralius]|nr:penicillin-binding protein [Bacillus sp. V33-4]RSK53189.1 penicillin-binding protein [Bacillus canaveralius]